MNNEKIDLSVRNEMSSENKLELDLTNSKNIKDMRNLAYSFNYNIEASFDDSK